MASPHKRLACANRCVAADSSFRVLYSYNAQVPWGWALGLPQAFPAHCSGRLATAPTFSPACLPDFVRFGVGPVPATGPRSNHPLTVDHAFSNGFRYGEALHPGPPIPAVTSGVAGHCPNTPAFLCPVLPAPLQPANRNPPPRVLSRRAGGRPKPRATLPQLFDPAGPAPNDAKGVTYPASQAPSDLRSRTADGSEPPCFRLAVLNPTSLLNKEAQLVALRCHVCLVSETSAVAKAQRIVSGRLRSTGFSWVWGTAVPPHQAETCRSDSLRGHAAGVAIASLFPVRLPFQPLDCTGVTAHRLILGHVRLGPLHARLIVVYGWPANHSAAKTKNETLFREVLQSVASSPLPTLVGGDFNTDVTQLPCWPEFQRLGYAELFSFCAGRFGQQLPPTCRNSTRHDSVLLPRVFQSLLQKACVDVDCHLFDSHAPVMLDFCLPQHNPCKQVWRKPTSWMEFEPDAKLAQQCYVRTRGDVQQGLDTCASREDLDAAFALWASVVETSVDFAVQQAHREDPLRCPVARLPRHAKGRCVYREVKAQALPVTAPQARCGDYSPPDEALSHRSRHKVKQVRRLQAFQRRLASTRSLARTRLPPEAAVTSLCQEWAAILAARGYPPCFGQWLLQTAHFVEAYDLAPAATWSEALPDDQCLLESLPPEDWLRDVSDFVRFECDAVIRQEQHQRRLLHAYQAAQDASTGLRQGYRSVRPSENPPFTSVPVEECQPAALDCCAKDGWGLYRVPAPEFFCAGCPAVADGQAVQVGACQQDEVFGPRLWLHFAQQPLPMSCKLCQATEAVTARELHRCFTNFWHPLWNRDQGPAATDLDCWTSFITSLPAPPPECSGLQLQLENPAFWQQHLRHLKPRSATRGTAASLIKSCVGCRRPPWRIWLGFSRCARFMAGPNILLAPRSALLPKSHSHSECSMVDPLRSLPTFTVCGPLEWLKRCLSTGPAGFPEESWVVSLAGRFGICRLHWSARLNCTSWHPRPLLAFPSMW